MSTTLLSGDRPIFRGSKHSTAQRKNISRRCWGDGGGKGRGNKRGRCGERRGWGRFLWVSIWRSGDGGCGGHYRTAKCRASKDAGAYVFFLYCISSTMTPPCSSSVGLLPWRRVYALFCCLCVRLDMVCFFIYYPATWQLKSSAIVVGESLSAHLCRYTS